MDGEGSTSDLSLRDVQAGIASKNKFNFYLSHQYSGALIMKACWKFELKLESGIEIVGYCERLY